MLYTSGVVRSRALLPGVLSHLGTKTLKSCHRSRAHAPSHVNLDRGERLFLGYSGFEIIEYAPNLLSPEEVINRERNDQDPFLRDTRRNVELTHDLFEWSLLLNLLKVFRNRHEVEG